MVIINFLDFDSLMASINSYLAYLSYLALVE